MPMGLKLLRSQTLTPKALKTRTARGCQLAPCSAQITSKMESTWPSNRLASNLTRERQHKHLLLAASWVGVNTCRHRRWEQQESTKFLFFPQTLLSTPTFQNLGASQTLSLPTSNQTLNTKLTKCTFLSNYWKTLPSQWRGLGLAIQKRSPWIKKQTTSTSQSLTPLCLEETCSSTEASLLTR